MAVDVFIWLYTIDLVFTSQGNQWLLYLLCIDAITEQRQGGVNDFFVLAKVAMGSDNQIEFFQDPCNKNVRVRGMLGKHLLDVDWFIQIYKYSIWIILRA